MSSPSASSSPLTRLALGQSFKQQLRTSPGLARKALRCRYDAMGQGSVRPVIQFWRTGPLQLCNLTKPAILVSLPPPACLEGLCAFPLVPGMFSRMLAAQWRLCCHCQHRPWESGDRRRGHRIVVFDCLICQKISEVGFWARVLDEWCHVLRGFICPLFRCEVNSISSDDTR